MPTYEYACQACGHRFEEFQSITAKPTKKCPQCKKLKVQRLISAGAGFIFKGSGFYITDYRSDSYKSAAKSDSSSSSSSAATPATSAATPSKTGATPASTTATPAPAATPAKPSGSTTGGGKKTAAA